LEKFVKLVLHVDVEVVDLAVHGDELTGGIEERRGVEETPRAGLALQYGSTQHIDTQLPHQPAEKVGGRSRNGLRVLPLRLLQTATAPQLR
jgi:hypothetical protein